jgi:hypothetical protein
MNLEETFLIDKWVDESSQQFYLITHGHKDHLRQLVSLPHDKVTVIVGKTKYSYQDFTVLSDYRKYLERNKRLSELIAVSSEFKEISGVHIRVITDYLHSDIFEIKEGSNSAIIIGDIYPTERRKILDILKNKQPNSVYFVVYSPAAEHRELPNYENRALQKAVNYIGKALKTHKRRFPVPPYIVAMGHSEGAKKPWWADKFLPKSAKTMDEISEDLWR